MTWKTYHGWGTHIELFDGIFYNSKLDHAQATAQLSLSNFKIYYIKSHF